MKCPVKYLPSSWFLRGFFSHICHTSMCRSSNKSYLAVSKKSNFLLNLIICRHSCNKNCHPEAMKQPQTITLHMFDCCYDIFIKSCVSVNFSVHRIFSYVLGIIRMFFGIRWAFMLFLISSNFHYSPMDAIFVQQLSYCWIMNFDLKWGERGLQFFSCCSGFFYDLMDK